MTPRLRRLVLATLLLASAAAAAAHAAPLPGDSVYALDLPLERAAGGTVKLARFRGRTLLLAMFYSQCNSACPLLVERLRTLVKGLTPAERGRLAIVLVSLDPARDAPTALRAFARLHHISGHGWTLARASAPDTRALATVLGIRYRNNPDGSITHSAPISLLDANGVLIAHTAELDSGDVAFESELHRALQK